MNYISVFFKKVLNINDNCGIIIVEKWFSDSMFVYFQLLYATHFLCAGKSISKYRISGLEISWLKGELVWQM